MKLIEKLEKERQRLNKQANDGVSGVGSQENKIGKGLYVVLGILSTWAMYDIVTAFLK